MRPVLLPRTVHVWRIPLDPGDAAASALAPLLSADERERAARFRFDHHRRRFVVGRGSMRLLLGAYAGTPAAEIVFAYGKHGKPRLSGAAFGHDVRFNFSNSHELALLAVTLGAEVGVDLERIKPMPRFMRLAERFFTAREADALAGLPESARIEAFFHCWTRKEAFLKSTGDGLHFDLDRVEVSVVPGEPARLCAVDGNPAAASRWHLESFVPEEGYVGALVVDGKVDLVETFSMR